MRRCFQTATACAVALCSFGCRDVERFDTGDGDAYCGSIVAAPFVRTPVDEDGFRNNLRLRLRLDTAQLDRVPGAISTDDTEGPCAPQATFEEARLVAIKEISHDPLFTLNFGDGREQNILAWAESSCRGSMLVVVSLMSNDNVEVRLLKNASPNPIGSKPARPGFAVFPLTRRTGTCGF